MKLRIFQSEKGDCLLLQSADGKNVLCDGGMSTSMRSHVRGRLASLVGQGKLDYVYVSHIDEDHISGVLQLLEDALEWKVYDYHRGNGHSGAKRPKFPRPPAIGGLWHNSFRDQVTKNRGDIEKLLAASAPALLATGVPALAEAAKDALNIATSIPQALRVSRLLKGDLLGIPLNRIPGRTGSGKLMYLRGKARPFRVGSLRFTIIGPTQKGLQDLRKGWDNWLRGQKDAVKKIRAEMKKRVEALGNGYSDGSPLDLRDWNGVPDYKNVTPPNIASLIFLVEEGGKTLLLTGDAQQDVILDGLKRAELLNGDHLHVDVLKVQHHGSENNLDVAFCRAVSADHYVFCGDGKHENPDLGVLKTVYQSRMGAETVRARSPLARNRRFTFWFSTTAAKQPRGSRHRRHFEKIERAVKDMVASSAGKMRAKFNAGDYLTLTL